MSNNKSAVQWLANKLRDEYGYDLTVHEHPRKLLEEALERERNYSQSHKEDRFLFTPENLIANLDKIGPWSCYGLASEALQHYFPERYPCDVETECNLMYSMGCDSWQDVVVKYHNKVGYKAQEGHFNPGAVNEY